MTILDQLVQSLSRFPGVGKKSATRMAYFLLESDSGYTRKLSEEIRDLKDRITHCNVCGSYTEQNPCDICTNSTRDRSVICVVEEPGDIVTLEAIGEYHGMYHVLGGAISPLDGVSPEDLSIDKLFARVEKDMTSEVIIATNPTVEGDTTALYLGKLLKERNIRVSRLASGLPVGGDLEYADRLTLAKSLRGRIVL